MKKPKRRTPADLQTCVAPEFRTSDVLAVAAQIAEKQDFGLCPILADALQDAGYADETVLRILRHPVEQNEYVPVVTGLVPALRALPDLMEMIQDVLEDGSWAIGINPDRTFPPKALKYVTGELVRVTSKPDRKSQKKCYYVRSYRAGGVGAYRLMREDGKLFSTSNVKKWLEKDELSVVEVVYNVDGVQHTGKFWKRPGMRAEYSEGVYWLELAYALLHWNPFYRKWEVRWIYDLNIAASMNATHYYKEPECPH